MATFSIPEPIPAGALFTVTQGAYSDFCIEGVFRAKEEIPVHYLLQAWLKEHPEQKEDYRFEDDEFFKSIAHMMEPVECWELHLSDYSKASTLSVEKMKRR